MMERLFPVIRYEKKENRIKKVRLFLNKPHSRYKQKREVKSTSFSVDNSALFQHSDTFDMMCVGKHINRLYLREFESFSRQEFDISCHGDRVARNV